ncbi:MAG: hypothetical protein H0V73_08450 [Chloroflexi bacterium]|nr:hypothetical protein [Chloroflexota bacterium]
MEQVLSLWREAERDLEGRPDNDPASSGIRADIERLRWLFQAITADLRPRRNRFPASDQLILEALLERRSIGSHPALVDRAAIEQAPTANERVLGDDAPEPVEAAPGEPLMAAG